MLNSVFFSLFFSAGDKTINDKSEIRTESSQNGISNREAKKEEDKYFHHHNNQIEHRLSDSIKGQREGERENGDQPANPVTSQNGRLFSSDHPFIVTHVYPRKEVTRGGERKFRSKKCLDSWQLSYKQTVKWSELANVKNQEIDGVSKLRVRQDKISFEYCVYDDEAAECEKK